MTGYHISVGYNSGAKREDVWRELKLVVEQLRHQSQAIIDELRRVEGPLAFGDQELREYAEMYGAQRDLTLTIHEAEDDREAQIVQLASGGGTARDIKEALRRSFSRLVIAAMHTRRMEVNLHVA